ncbi:MAG TPA: hypothetical protein VGI91_08590 [Steroidobacteraceae bacterium]|jgi:hypothetical protein
MPDPSTSATVVRLKLDAGTLYATPNGGHVRVLRNTEVTFTANFPFTVEVSALTGNGALPSGAGASCPGPSGTQTVKLTMPDCSETPTSTPAPSFKYTVKGGPEGEAAGKVLDPIIIVDKR